MIPETAWQLYHIIYGQDAPAWRMIRCKVGAFGSLITAYEDWEA
jgi:hypothetical protein